MTDNDILWAFQKGMPLLRADHVDHRDSDEILSALESCAKKLIPIIHKYGNEEKKCVNCEHWSAKNEYCNLSYKNECYNTIDRPKFKLKKGSILTKKQY